MPKQLVLISWMKPAKGWFKATTDAVVYGRNSCIGVGIILRDHDRLVVGSSMQKITIILSPNMEKAVALYRGIRFTVDTVLVPAIMESDTKDAIDMVMVGTAPFVDIGVVISVILALVNHYPIFVVHVPSRQFLKKENLLSGSSKSWYSHASKGEDTKLACLL
ncbi:hypothetical protein Dsin_019014 [Dipteronia sinensis]|uniref:RNase H type-1 domain-containing protein n=1 Tax=Dipteronia sinensis TaxID=43782 RepID=A0AAE0A7V4_9ROSI|nr:hypothetical protein Dsin_019014 [Dipteronia sinensis]